MDWLYTHLTWTHPLAWGVYAYACLSLITAFALLWFRITILRPERAQLAQEAPQIQQQVQAGRQQLRHLNRQVDRGLDQIEALLDIVTLYFLPVLESKLASLLLLKLDAHSSFIKLGSKKALQAIFSQLELALRTANKPTSKRP